MNGRVIILHGPSSSGKSTIAVALQEMIELPFWHISIDHMRDSGVLPTDRLKREEFNWSELRTPFFDGFHRSLAAYSSSGNNLIVEHILDSPEWVADLKGLLAPFDVFFAGVHCSIEELTRREAARGNRPVGSAETDFRTVHNGRVYDIEIDGERDAAENARLIVERWRSNRRTSEFFRQE